MSTTQTARGQDDGIMNRLDRAERRLSEQEQQIDALRNRVARVPLTVAVPYSGQASVPYTGAGGPTDLCAAPVGPFMTFVGGQVTLVNTGMFATFTTGGVNQPKVGNADIHFVTADGNRLFTATFSDSRCVEVDIPRDVATIAVTGHDSGWVATFVPKPSPSPSSAPASR